MENTCKTCINNDDDVSQMYGGFATCNRQGQIEIRTYIDSNYSVDTGRYWDTFEHHDVTESIDKITCYTGKDAEGNDLSVSVGSGTRAISFSNPFMTQSMLDNVWKTLKGYTYMPGTVKIMGDPRLDPWDVLTVCDLNGETYKVPVMDMTHEFDGGLITSVEAVGRSEVEQESGYKGPTTQNMDRYYAQLVIGQFTRYIHMALVVGGKLLVVGSKAICLQVDA